MSCQRYNDNGFILGSDALSDLDADRIVFPYNAVAWFRGFTFTFTAITGGDSSRTSDKKGNFTGSAYLAKHCKQKPDSLVIEIARDYLKEISEDE